GPVGGGRPHVGAGLPGLPSAALRDRRWAPVRPGSRGGGPAVTGRGDSPPFSPPGSRLLVTLYSQPHLPSARFLFPGPRPPAPYASFLGPAPRPAAGPPPEMASRPARPA